MKTLLLLFIVLCTAFAAPAEEKANAPAPAEEKANAPVPAQAEDQAPETEDQMGVEPAAAAADSAPAADERFNFCPDGWFSHGARCFVFVNTPMNWYRAEEHCNGLGGHLASATNPGEYSFMQRITQTAGQSVAWMGGFNLQGQWMWIDRKGFYFTKWWSQNSWSSSPCIYLRSSTGWSNTRCSYSYRFLCSRDPFGC